MLLPLHLNLGEAAPTPADQTPSSADRLGPEYYLLTVAEITEATDVTNILVYDEDAWNSGKVYG